MEQQEAVKFGMSEIAHHRNPGVVFGPEHGGWVGLYLPFEARQVLDDPGLREGNPIENPDRAALRIMDIFIAAMRPERALLTGMECEVLDIVKAALSTIRSKKVIVST